MISRFYIILFFLLLGQSHAQVYKELFEQLREMRNLDQLLRNNIDGLKVKIGADSVFIAKFTIIDSMNNPRLKEIFEVHGYPDSTLVGMVGAHNFWLLVQHQDFDTAFQKSVLTAMKVKADLGLVRFSDYAYLYDRVMKNTGRKQLYGTQMSLNRKDNRMYPVPIEDSVNLDDRRKKAGLIPMTDYLKLFGTQY